MSAQIEDEAGEGTDRRSVLKKAAVLGAGVWAAPVITSITTPAFATGSDPSGPCITLTEERTVTAEVVAYMACNTLEFGLQSPTLHTVCNPCGSGTTVRPGSQTVLGTFAAGTELVFYLRDPADCCGCSELSTCRDVTKASVSKVNAAQFRVRFRDNGCYGTHLPNTSCGGSSIIDGANLEAIITLS